MEDPKEHNDEVTNSTNDESEASKNSEESLESSQPSSENKADAPAVEQESSQQESSEGDCQEDLVPEKEMPVNSEITFSNIVHPECNQEKAPAKPQATPKPETDVSKSEDKEQQISGGKVKEKLLSGEVIENCELPFMNLSNMTFSEDIVIQNCKIQGLMARGTVFRGKLHIYNCEFAERVDFSGRKEDNGYVETIFEDEIRLENCCFADTLHFRRTVIQGQVIIHKCNVTKDISFDHSQVQRRIALMGPGEIARFSGFKAHFGHNFLLKEYTVSGINEDAIDFVGATVEGILEVFKSTVERATKLRRSKIGGQTKEALIFNESVFGKIDLQECCVVKKALFSQIKCHGVFDAEMPKASTGKKVGARTKFQDDVLFEDSTFAKKFTMHDATVEGYTNFRKCVFDNELIISQANLAQVVSFWEVTVQKAMHAKKTRFGFRTSFGNTQIGEKSSFNEAVFEGETRFFNFNVEGDVFFTSAIFQGDFTLRKVHIKGGLGIKRIIVSGNCNLAAALIEDRLIVSESQFLGAFIAPGMVVGTWATFDKCLFKGDVDLTGFRTGKNANDSEITEEMASEMDDLEKKTKAAVPGSCYFNGAAFRAEFDFSNARIFGRLEMDGVKTYSEAEFIGMQVGHNLHLSKSHFRGVVHFSISNIKGAVISRKARYKEEVSFNKLTCRHLFLKNSSFDNGFTMRGTEVSHGVILTETDVDGKADLYQASFKNISFNHFLVDRFLISRESLGDRLRSERKGNFEAAKNEYGILKQAFQMRNQYRDMDWAYYRFCQARRQERKEKSNNPLNKLLVFCEWLFLDIGFGYGTRPMNIAGVTLACVLIFALIFSIFPVGIIGTGADGNLAPLKSIKFSDAFYMSLITFSSMDYGDTYPNFAHWLKYLFSLEGLLGIFLTTMFVATISRKIIRM